MPGRNRRVRLLAVAVCIAVVFFLYQRNEAQVEQYANYIAENAVGGGSVLRPEQKAGAEQAAIVEEPASPTPATPPDPGPLVAAEPTTTATIEAAGSTETTSALAEAPTRAAEGQATVLPFNPTQDNELPLPIEVSGEGRVEEDAYQKSQQASTSSYPPIHWSKLPEHFPVTSTIQLPSGTPKPIPLIQDTGKGGAETARLAAVKQATQHAWKGFRDNGWDFDEVRPVSGGGKNSFNGWGATLVDSLDTLWIMGMKDEFEEAVNKTAEIDFTTSSRNDIPMFEVTIRYLGGMIAAYDVSGRKYRVLLDKAVELAEILYSAFDTPNRMPETYYYWKPEFASNKHRASQFVVLAEIGTLSLEFTRLAQLTGEPKYYDAIARITDEFEKWQNNTRLPGMWPTAMDASGCAKPVRLRPSQTHLQVTVPGGDTNMMTSEPVNVEGETMAAAESKLDDVKSSYSGTKEGGGSMGTVANPVNPMMGGAFTNSDDSGMRHDMADHPANNEKSSHATTSDDKTNRPLAPESEGSHAETYMENATNDHRAKGALPPGSGPVNRRRQLEDVGEVVEPTVNGIMPTVPNTALLPVPEEPDCIPQGFASTSRNSPETYTLGGQSDSVYEYLPKMHLLIGGRFDQYKDIYLASTQPVIDKLLFRPMNQENLDLLISGELKISVNYTSGEYVEKHIAKGEHLTCFAGGMMAMGGKLFNLPEHVEIGAKITNGCVWTYNATSSGIMPEGFQVTPCESNEKQCEWNETKWHEDLDIYGHLRAGQRTDFAEQYNMTMAEIEEYEEELYATTSSSMAVAKVTPASVVATKEDDRYPSDMNKLRRQLEKIDQPIADNAPALPQPALLPTEAPSSTTASEDVIWGGYPPSEEEEDDYVPAPIYTPRPPPTHQRYVAQKIHDERLPPGFTRFDSRKYILRPEAIESVFYMYRITGDQYWRDMGWKMFTAVERATRAPYGHSAIDDVTKATPEHLDGMESFWIAETLKYFYLLFDEPDTWSLDDWVLNTEAHFFRRPENPT